jgi:hypothetical protein
VRIFLRHFAVRALGFGPLLVREGDPAQPQPKLRQKVIRRQIARELVPLLALGAQDEQGRRPVHLEPVKGGGLLFDVDFDGNEVLVYEVGDPRVRIDLGIQPSAGPSSRGGAEVQQQGLVFLLGPRQGGIYILGPFDGHDVPPQRMSWN